VAAVVSRGGRPDLAGPALAAVRAPTLLIVGGADYGVIGLNRDAFARLGCEKRLEIVPGATHLFEEPGTLEQVVGLAGAWFGAHFAAAGRTATGQGPATPEDAPRAPGTPGKRAQRAMPALRCMPWKPSDHVSAPDPGRR
jgi:hypothetical protein